MLVEEDAPGKVKETGAHRAAASTVAARTVATGGVPTRCRSPGGPRHRWRAPAIRRERREGKPLAEIERGMRECMVAAITVGAGGKAAVTRPHSLLNGDFGAPY
jgi:hypothetical protein